MIARDRLIWCAAAMASAGLHLGALLIIMTHTMGRDVPEFGLRVFLRSVTVDTGAPALRPPENARMAQPERATATALAEPVHGTAARPDTTAVPAPVTAASRAQTAPKDTPRAAPARPLNRDVARLPGNRIAAPTAPASAASTARVDAFAAPAGPGIGAAQDPRPSLATQGASPNAISSPSSPEDASQPRAVAARALTAPISPDIGAAQAVSPAPGNATQARPGLATSAVVQTPAQSAMTVVSPGTEQRPETDAAPAPPIRTAVAATRPDTATPEPSRSARIGRKPASAAQARAPSPAPMTGPQSPVPNVATNATSSPSGPVARADPAHSVATPQPGASAARKTLPAATTANPNGEPTPSRAITAVDPAQEQPRTALAARSATPRPAPAAQARINSAIPAAPGQAAGPARPITPEIAALAAPPQQAVDTPDQAGQSRPTAPQTDPKSSPPDTLSQILKDFDGGPCFAGAAHLASNQGLHLDLFGQDDGAAQRLANQIPADLGPRIAYHPISAAQCRALSFYRSAAAYPEIGLRITLASDRIDSGGYLSGRIIDAGTGRLWLFLIDDEGLVQDISGFLAPLPGVGARFRVPLSVTGAPVATRQLLLALDGVNALPELSPADGLDAAVFFDRLTEYVALASRPAGRALAAFTVR